MKRLVPALLFAVTLLVAQLFLSFGTGTSPNLAMQIAEAKAASERSLPSGNGPMTGPALDDALQATASPAAATPQATATSFIAPASPAAATPQATATPFIGPASPAAGSPTPSTGTPAPTPTPTPPASPAETGSHSLPVVLIFGGIEAAIIIGVLVFLTLRTR